LSKGFSTKGPALTLIDAQEQMIFISIYKIPYLICILIYN